VGLDREVKEGIQEIKGEVYKRTSVNSTRLRQKMRMKVNALDYAIGSVLSIKCEDERWRLVAFFSKSLNKIKRNYKIHNKKMLVVIRELVDWRHLLEGVTTQRL